MKIGARIKELRKKNNLTQQQLADRLHTVRQTIISWEQDKFVPDTPNQIALSRALGLPDNGITEMLYLDKTTYNKGAEDLMEETAVLLAAEDTEQQAESVQAIVMMLYEASKIIEKALNSIDRLPLITEVDHDLLGHQLEYMERQIGVAREYLGASAYVKEQKPPIDTK